MQNKSLFGDASVQTIVFTGAYRSTKFELLRISDSDFAQDFKDTQSSFGEEAIRNGDTHYFQIPLHTLWLLTTAEYMLFSNRTEVFLQPFHLCLHTSKLLGVARGLARGYRAVGQSPPLPCPALSCILLQCALSKQTWSVVP